MEVYRTEQEQIEAIKKFFHEYGNYLVAGVLIFVLIFVGYLELIIGHGTISYPPPKERL